MNLDQTRRLLAAVEKARTQRPLARRLLRLYVLRRAAAAAVSTWLAAGVPSAQCAQWAGHSVAVLHQVYAKVLDGQEDEARNRITAALGADPTPKLGHVLVTEQP